MAEKNNGKDPLENFFRQQLEEIEGFNISYNEADWERLEKKLDVRDRIVAARRWKRWAIAATVLLASLLGYLIYQNWFSASASGARLARNNSALHQKHVAHSLKNYSGRTNSPIFNSTENEQLSTSKSVESSEKKQPHSSNAKISAQINGRSQISENGLESRGGGESIFVSSLTCSGCIASNFENKKILKRPLASLLLQQPAPEKTANAAKQNRGTGSNVLSYTVGKTAWHQRHSRIKLGVILSPVFSTSGSLSNFTKPGSQIGFTIGYAIGPKFVIRAGIIHSRVNYTALKGEFNPYSYGNYFKDENLSPETYANCALLDIPLSIEYKFLQFHKSALYAAAGVSSYIMLDENYRFDYPGTRPGGLHEEWSKRTGDGYWLSNMDFSIGYEFQIYPHLSLGVEPYIEVPLKGVGIGNIKLYSLGSMFSVNYSLW